MNRKLILLVILLSLCAWDLSNRFLLDMIYNAQQEGIIIVDSQLPLKLTKIQQDELIQLYRAFNPKNNDDAIVVEEGMSTAAQHEQNGRLDQLYSGDLRIRLSAVIRQVNASETSGELIFALLDVQNVKDVSHSLLKVQFFEQVHGYKVQDIQLNQISLVSVNDVDRVIILPIYQKRSAVTPEQTLNRTSL